MWPVPQGLLSWEALLLVWPHALPSILFQGTLASIATHSAINALDLPVQIV